jgi:preprotein translocase subunit SecY
MSSELWRRIAFTIGALIVYRIAAFIPIPGIDPELWAAAFQRSSGGILGQANLFSGGAVRALAVTSLSIAPYVNAAIFLRIFALVSRRQRELERGGEGGRQSLERRTRMLAAAIAAIQAYGVATSLERIPGVVAEPGPLFVVTAMATFVGGTFFLVWLAGRITARGIGNGLALILAAGIVGELPRTIVDLVRRSELRMLPDKLVPALVLIVVAVTVVVVLIEGARRRIPVRFAERQAGDRTLPAQTVDLALKLNPAGLMPSVIAGALVFMAANLGTIAGLFAGEHGRGFAHALGETLYSTPVYLFVETVLIFVFMFAYTAFVCDPEQMAQSLEARGGAIVDVAPGEPTAAHLDGVLSRTALTGAIYLTLIVLLPIILTLVFPDFALFIGSGTAFLVLVCVTLDLRAQARALNAPALVPSQEQNKNVLAESPRRS